MYRRVGFSKSFGDFAMYADAEPEKASIPKPIPIPIYLVRELQFNQGVETVLLYQPCDNAAVPIGHRVESLLSTVLTTACDIQPPG